MVEGPKYQGLRGDQLLGREGGLNVVGVSGPLLRPARRLLVHRSLLTERGKERASVGGGRKSHPVISLDLVRIRRVEEVVLRRGSKDRRTSPALEPPDVPEREPARGARPAALRGRSRGGKGIAVRLQSGTLGARLDGLGLLDGPGGQVSQRRMPGERKGMPKASTHVRRRARASSGAPSSGRNASRVRCQWPSCRARSAAVRDRLLRMRASSRALVAATRQVTAN